MLTHHDGAHVRLPARDFLHREPKFEPRPHPWHVGHRPTEDLLRQFLAPRRGRDRNDRIGVHVIHELPGQEGVKRRVNRRRPRVQIERRMRVHGHHVILRRRLQATVRACGVKGLQPTSLSW
jgi:hypothetical protein